MLLSACVFLALVARFDALSNVCRNIEDYENIVFGEGDCWYDPDAVSTIEQVPQNHNYTMESYKVTTKDGYVLTLHRIPNGQGEKNSSGKQPVYLQHGLFGASSLYLLNGNESLPFMLADAGYDVWLGNARGSYPSRRHTKYSPKDSRFWDFSFHEMAINDLPTNLNYIAKLTGRKDIIYIGQSMGTTIAYVYASTMPEHAEQRLKLIVALAPEVFMGKMRSSVKYLTNLNSLLQQFSTGLGFQELLPYNPTFYKSLCLASTVTYNICQAVIYETFGYSPGQHRPELTPIVYQFYPTGASLKTLVHYGQLVRKDRFTQFDYGPILNLAYYKSMEAPEYDLSKVKIPSYLMHGPNDPLSPIEGLQRLNESLSNAVIHELENDEFSHFDYFNGKDVVEVVYDKVLDYISKFKS